MEAEQGLGEGWEQRAWGTKDELGLMPLRAQGDGTEWWATCMEDSTPCSSRENGRIVGVDNSSRSFLEKEREGAVPGEKVRQRDSLKLVFKAREHDPGES